MLNALRNGHTGQVVVLPEEDMQAFTGFTTQLVDSFRTANALERQLAYSYASYQWRINRVANIENVMFTLGIMEDIAGNLNLENPDVHNAVSNAKTFRSEAREFERLSMYNQRLVNQSEKVLKQLQRLQAERHTREQAELAEAVKLYTEHHAKGATFDPKALGFDVTLPQIESQARRLRKAAA